MGEKMEEGNQNNSNTPVLTAEEKKLKMLQKLEERLQKDEEKGIVIERSGVSPIQQNLALRQSFQPVTISNLPPTIPNMTTETSQATASTLVDNIVASPHSQLNFDPQRSLMVMEPEQLSQSNLGSPKTTADPTPSTTTNNVPKSEFIDLVIIDSSPSRSNSSLPGRSRDGPPGKKRRQYDDNASNGGGTMSSIPYRSDSIDHSNDFNAKKSPKLDKMESPNHQIEGSSKNTMKVRSIVSYFVQNKDTPAAKEIVTINSSEPLLPTSASSDTLFLDTPRDKTNRDSLGTSQGSGKQKVLTSATTSQVPPNPGNSNVMKEMQNSINELKKQLDAAKIAKDQSDLKGQRLEADIKVYADKMKALEDRNNKLMKSLEDVYRKMAQQEFRRTRDRLALDNVRLGKISTHRTGPQTFSEVWEEGYSMKDLNKRNAELIARKEELEARKKRVAAINKKRAGSKKAGSGDDSNDSVNVAAELDMDLDVMTEQEAIRAHMEQLKRDEMALAEERRLLESEKAIHIKELKRTQCEERSRFFRDLPCFNNRYLLQSLLGRGGFSEVWKAFDIVEIREVAVKIHQLNPQWSEERKSSYIKHVTREYNIHREMRHARVVQLYDVFEIDLNSFATVLEYCKGIDLDEKLKRMKTLPEKDAKAILMQIFGGLRYLNRPLGYAGMHVDNPENAASSSSSNNNMNNKRRSIIHYDLKPANILFDEMGDVKITDFGLAKIIDESNEGTSMELTSQGAGTYWYLPPECFDKGPNPRISSKVDVWSAGVVFFQMLYGYRPFGEGKTQENVWSENIIYNSSSVEFSADPKAPKVSEEAKDLIRACLTKDPRLRPDIDAIWLHSYFRK